MSCYRWTRLLAMPKLWFGIVSGLYCSPVTRCTSSFGGSQWKTPSVAAGAFDTKGADSNSSESAFAFTASILSPSISA